MVTIVASAVAALGVTVGAVSWYQLSPAERGKLAGGAGTSAGWLAVVLLLPWATFFLSTWAGKGRSNARGVVLIAGYTILESVGLWWVFEKPELAGGVLLIGMVGVLMGAVYNLLACDWIAERWS